MLDDNSICCVKSMAGGDWGRVGEVVGDDEVVVVLLDTSASGEV